MYKKIYNGCFFSIATTFSAFCYDFYSFVIYASVYGFTIGAYVGLTSVILVDLLGLDRLTNAFGLLLLFQGIASFLGPPIAGTVSHVYDEDSSHILHILHLVPFMLSTQHFGKCSFLHCQADSDPMILSKLV
jgi:MFS family permease